MGRTLAWLRRWGASVASLGGGLLTLFVFRRGLPNVGWIVGYLMLVSLLFIVFIELRLPLASAFLASVALTPAVRRRRQSDWLAALRSTVAVAVVAATAVALGRVAIPPAPLFLARAELVWDVIGMDARELAPDTVGADELRQRGLVAYTAIYAPAGLSQPITHVWRRNGQVVNVVSLSPVQGGRQEGFRTYSRKTSFPADPAGRWTVDVETSSGQLIGRLRFRVTP